MGPEDVAAVVAIERDSTGGPTWDSTMIHEELGRAWAHLWVVRGDGGTPVAFVATWLVQDELHVLNIATGARQRRRGHARSLLEHALGFAVEHGVRHVLLEVRRSNMSAIGLYRQLGFVAMGLRAHYYGDEEDAVEMLLRLDPTTGEVIRGRDEVRLG
jgi:ribosomal-protein-alanine N-acetyltransferase